MRLRVEQLIVVALAVCAGCDSQTPVDQSVSKAPATAAARNFIDGLRAKVRPIRREPQYVETPMYALLAFGDDAEHQSWLVVDGPTVYLDRDGDGDLTGVDERILLDEEDETAAINVTEGEYKGMNVFNLGNVSGHDFLLRVWVLNEEFVPDPNEDEFMSRDRQERIENSWANASLFRVASPNRGVQIPVLLCPRPEDAQISHMDGPLTFEMKWGDRQKLEHNKENVFEVHIGTQGVTTTNSRYPVFSQLTTEELPADVHPMAVFEFPNQVQNGQPLKLAANLDQRC